MVFRWIKRIIFIVVIAAVLLFLSSGIRDTSLEQFRITGISQVDIEGFVFDAQLVLNNPSRLPVPVSDVVYNATLERSGERIGSGDFGTFILSPGESTADFDQRINWAPTARTAVELLMYDEVWMVVNGMATIDIPVIGEVSFDFEDRIDIKEYVEQFTRTAGVGGATEQVNDSVDQANGSIENLSEGVSSVLS